MQIGGGPVQFDSTVIIGQSGTTCHILATVADSIHLSESSDVIRTENATATKYLDKVKEQYTSYHKMVTLPSSAFVASGTYKLFDTNDEFDVYEFGVRKGTDTINLDDTAFHKSAFKMLLSFQGYSSSGAGSSYIFDYNNLVSPATGGIHTSLKMMGDLIGYNLYGANDGTTPNTADIPSVVSYHVSGMNNPELQWEAPSSAPHNVNIKWGSSTIHSTITGSTKVFIKLVKITDFL
jgi:hypothetical protein